MVCLVFSDFGSSALLLYVVCSLSTMGGLIKFGRDGYKLYIKSWDVGDCDAGFDGPLSHKSKGLIRGAIKEKLSTLRLGECRGVISTTETHSARTSDGEIYDVTHEIFFKVVNVKKVANRIVVKIVNIV